MQVPDDRDHLSGLDSFQTSSRQPFEWSSNPVQDHQDHLVLRPDYSHPQGRSKALILWSGRKKISRRFCTKYEVLRPGECKPSGKKSHAGLPDCLTLGLTSQNPWRASEIHYFTFSPKTFVVSSGAPVARYIDNRIRNPRGSLEGLRNHIISHSASIFLMGHQR